MGIGGKSGSGLPDWLAGRILASWFHAVTGGEGGIRTLDRVVRPYNGLANRRLQPLGHLSGVKNQALAVLAFRRYCKRTEKRLLLQHGTRHNHRSIGRLLRA